MNFSVLSSVTYSLKDNIENITLLGTSSINATGNSSANIINGNSGINILMGASGNDTYSTKAGNDIIVDTAGDDTYIFNIGDGSDKITDCSGNDKIIFGEGIDKEDIVMTWNSTDLVIKYGVTDQVTISRQKLSSYVIEEIQLQDNTLIDHSKINTIVQAMASFTSNTGIDLTTGYGQLANNNEWQTVLTTANQ